MAKCVMLVSVRQALTCPCNKPTTAAAADDAACRVDPNTPVTETFAEFKALVDEGKVRYVGISEASPEDIRAAHAVTPISAVQLEWSLWSR